MAAVVICEPWLGGSHQAWARGLADRSRHDVRVLGLEARAWRWRLRASAAWFAERLSTQPKPDLVIVSGLLDAAALRGLIDQTIPLVAYMHESQGSYPSSHWDVEAVARNWMSMLSADEVWFNSSFHRQVALAQVSRLLDEMPSEQRVDAVHRIESKSSVVYPGVELGFETTGGSRATIPTIVWPHRWEHDKNPDVFERALAGLVRSGRKFRLVVAGADGQPPSEARKRILADHSDRLLAAGPFSRSDYRRWLGASDLVVSCTSHEFFGMAVIEAVAAGCVPVLPREFSYPEIFGDQAGLYEPGRFGSALADSVDRYVPAQRTAVDVSRFDWGSRIGDYDDRITAISSQTDRR